MDKYLESHNKENNTSNSNDQMQISKLMNSMDIQANR